MAEFRSSPVMQELRAAYLKSLAAKMAEFATASSARDYVTVARMGHQLKGSGQSYGLPQISALGIKMEEVAEFRRAALLEPLLAEFMTLMNTLVDEQSSPEKS